MRSDGGTANELVMAEIAFLCGEALLPANAIIKH